MASRYPGGDAVTPAPGGWDLHPHGYLIIMVIISLCLNLTKLTIPLFPQISVKRIAQQYKYYRGQVPPHSRIEKTDPKKSR